jgi:curved DNA-binding protein CbpA
MAATSTVTDENITHYALLGIASMQATLGEIRSAYLKAARKTHPDKMPDKVAATHRFQAISEAYQVLKDTKRRAAYDKLLKMRGLYVDANTVSTVDTDAAASANANKNTPASASVPASASASAPPQPPKSVDATPPSVSAACLTPSFAYGVSQRQQKHARVTEFLKNRREQRRRKPPSSEFAPDTDADARMKKAEDHAQQAEAQAKVSEERAKQAEAQAKVSEERAKQAEAQAKVSEERAKQAEAQAKVSEERAKQAEAQAKIAEFRADAAENRATKAEENHTKVLNQLTDSLESQTKNMKETQSRYSLLQDQLASLQRLLDSRATMASYSPPMRAQSPPLPATVYSSTTNNTYSYTNRYDGPIYIHQSSPFDAYQSSSSLSSLSPSCGPNGCHSKIADGSRYCKNRALSGSLYCHMH